MIDAAGGCEGHWAGGAAGLPGEGKGRAWPGVLLPAVMATPCRDPSEGSEGQASPSHRGLASPGACSGLGHSHTTGWGAGRGRQGTPQGPTEPQAPAAQLSWGGWGGGRASLC